MVRPAIDSETRLGCLRVAIKGDPIDDNIVVIGGIMEGHDEFTATYGVLNNDGFIVVGRYP